MGFEEFDPDQVRGNISLEGEFLISKENGNKFQFGKLEIPTLESLRSRSILLSSFESVIKFEQVVANVQELHKTQANATFQAASQFNLLEMVNPDVSPEWGVDGYENDHTQGPACAIACGAGTIYRNYFVKIGDQIGQSRELQIDCLDKIGNYFCNEENGLWEMKNGYAFPSRNGLRKITKVINGLTPHEYETLKSRLRVGIQKNAEVTISENRHTLTQVYCSALPIRYTDIDRSEWEAFARLILEGLYEATFYAALENYKSTGNGELYLTLVGGGAFGNPIAWILDAISKSILKFRSAPLKVKIVSYGGRNQKIDKCLRELEVASGMKPEKP